MKEAFETSLRCPILIGRTDDLALCRSLLTQAENGKGAVVLLSGEAGVGKSRLVAEVKMEASSHGFQLLQGSCFPTDHAIPYALLLDLLRFSMFHRTPAFSEAEMRLLTQAFFPLLTDSASLSAHESLPSIKPLLDPEQEKRRRFEILAQFLLRQTQERPMLCVLEDLHWSDNTSLEFLHYLARRCVSHPFLLLLTYRNNEVHPGLRHFLAHLDREHLAQEVPLVHLTQNEVDAMLRAIFALPHAALVELVDPLYALTEGNPFFVEEILKSLLAAGDLFYTNGRWEHRKLGELHIPRSVQDTVQMRITHLSAPALRVLTLAAVAGRRFDFSLLQQLTSYDEETLLTLMKELLTVQLVVEESADQFAFHHALTRQAIYTSLLARERRMLHGRIADLLESLAGSSPDTFLADLAYHFFEAETWEKAVIYGQSAAEQAERLYTPHATIEQATRAISAAQQGAISLPVTLYQLRGRAYEILGNFEQALQDDETTLQLAQQAGDRHTEWQALMALGSLWAERDYTQTGAYYQQALALARSMNEPPLIARSLNLLGNWYTNIEQPVMALHSHKEALLLFQHMQDKPGSAQTYDLLGMANALGGDLLQASAYYQQAVALFQELDDRQGLASSLATLMVLGEGGGYETDTVVTATNSFALSLHFGEQALKTAREIGQPSAEVYALLALAQYLGPHGNYARAWETACASLALAKRIEHQQWLAGAHWQMGALYFDLLALPAAREHFEQALTLAHTVGSWNWIRIISAFLGLTYLLQQDHTAAEATLNAALEADAAMQTIGQRLVWSARAELALARGNFELALEIAERLIASATNLSSEHVLPRLWKLRGEALLALTRTEEAEKTLQAARIAAHRQGLQPLLWRICIQLGKLYHAQHSQEAEEQFETAQTLIKELATSVPDEQVQDQFLVHAMAMLPQRRPLTPARAARQAYDGLTAREREVATLIAQGKSNRDIATLLVVGNRTVEAHVSGILAKLSFSSRSQIAVWAHEKGLNLPKE